VQFSALISYSTVICLALCVSCATANLLNKNDKNYHACVTTDADYCQSEYFSANCSGVSDVILMESARYGRMRAGRCVSGYGKLGCYSDVLWYAVQTLSALQTLGC